MGQRSDCSSLQPLQQRLQPPSQLYLPGGSDRTVMRGFGGRPATTGKVASGLSGAPGLSCTFGPRTGQAPGLQIQCAGRFFSVRSLTPRTPARGLTPGAFTSQGGQVSRGQALRRGDSQQQGLARPVSCHGVRLPRPGFPTQPDLHHDPSLLRQPALHGRHRYSPRDASPGAE